MLLKEEVCRLVEGAMHIHFESLGKHLANTETGMKKYWPSMNSLFNKNKFPIIPLRLVNNVFVTNCSKEAQLLNTHSVQQDSLIETGSPLPQFRPLTHKVLDSCIITEENILNLIRSLNPNKVHGWGAISVKMILICDYSIVAPLEMVVQTVWITEYSQKYGKWSLLKKNLPND